MVTRRQSFLGGQFACFETVLFSTVSLSLSERDIGDRETTLSTLASSTVLAARSERERETLTGSIPAVLTLCGAHIHTHTHTLESIDKRWL